MAEETKSKVMTTDAGRPVGDNQNSLTVGDRGPIVFEDFLLFEKMAHFNRERVPERVVHAKGSGAYGTLTVTNPDMPKYTTAKLFSAGQIEDAAQLDGLASLLERRVVLLHVLRAALGEPGVYVRIGHENEVPALRSLALVATSYGLAQRKLGAVSVIGPVRMDYAGAIATVREAAQELSRFVEHAYATD